MKLEIGKKIKSLRKKNDITQDKLGEYLGVTAQAISKWESGDCYPDIEILPAIANFFNIQTDELLGVDIMKTNEKVEKLLEQVRENESKGFMRENITLLRTALQEFPNNYSLLQSLAFNLFMFEDRTEDDIKENISINERIVEDCPDNNMRNNALQELAYSYSRLGEKQKALDIVNKLPNINITRTVMLPRVTEGEEHISHLLSNISTFNGLLTEEIRIYARDKYTDKSNIEDMQKQIVLLKKCISIYEIVYENNDWGFANVRLKRYFEMIAEAYLCIGDCENALVYLEKVAETCITFDTLPEPFPYTSILFEGKAFYKKINMTTSIPESQSYRTLHALMENSLYDPIRETDKFEEIVEKLKPHAKKYD